MEIKSNYENPIPTWFENDEGLIVHIPQDFPDSMVWRNDWIPDCCKNCGNHPKNGGTGFCNCALPSLTNPTL